MDQKTLKLSLDGLERKILLLVREYNTFKEEIALLNQKKNDLLNEIKDKNVMITTMEEEIKISQIATSLNSTTSNHSLSLQRELDTYIRKIDKCIVHLGG